MVAILLLAGCGQLHGQTAGRTSPSTSPATAAPSGTALVPSATANASPSPAPGTEPPQASPAPSTPSVQCLQGDVPQYQALRSGPSGSVLYDVTDPLHPRAVCKIYNAMAHIVTGTAFEYLVPHPDGTTDVVLHALGSNNETVAATFKADLYDTNLSFFVPVAWSPTVSAMAYLADGGTDANGLGVTDVWLATASGRTKIFSYSVPGRDAFGRPGFAPITLAFSPDGAYLAAGWTVATSPVQVFRLSDRANVAPAWPSDFRFAFWAKHDDTLFVVGLQSVATWKPAGPVTALPSTPAWVLQPNLSPDGTQVAFTTLTSTGDVRPYTYDLDTATSRRLVDQSRSATSFVRSGWIWYAEETPCVQSDNSPCFDPTQPDGNVLALDLASGRESLVTFAAGEGPPSFGQAPVDLWPSN